MTMFIYINTIYVTMNTIYMNTIYMNTMNAYTWIPWIYMNTYELTWIHIHEYHEYTYTGIPWIPYTWIPYTWPCSYTWIPKKYPTAPNWSGYCLLHVAIATEYQQRRHYDGPSPWWKNGRFLGGINHIFPYPTYTLTESPWLIVCPQDQWWDWLHRPSLHYPFSISKSIC